MRKTILIISSCFTLISQAQTFPVGHMSINFKDPSRTSTGYSISGGIAMTGTGRTIGTEVYYPATVAGNNSTVASGQFPIIVFGHGFAMTYDNYDNVYNRLASLGYIVLLPRTESGIFPTPVHADFGLDLKSLANQGMALNTINTPTALAVFNGKVIQKSAIGGHSMGAGCSFLAAASNNTLTCIFNFAAATSNNTPNSIASASLVTVPALLISGEKDSVADSLVQNDHYNSTASTKKFHAIIKGVTHCDFGNGTSGTCTIGQAACSGTGCNAVLFEKYMTYVEPFLANQLKNNCAEGNRFMDSINTASPNRVGRKITGSIACASTGMQKQTLLNNFSIFPNPTEGKLNISYSAEATTPVLFELYDISGRLVLQSSETASGNMKKEINIENIDNGSYILFIHQNELKNAFKIIKQ
jgi:dienelactone hydrolase